MQGAPLAQAKKAVEACLSTLTEKDRFGFVAFDTEVEVFQPQLADGTQANREKLSGFLSGIESRGGTELAAGVHLIGCTR